jgi:glycosyltransferase involved in cell wall biosynthesis
MSNHKKQKLLFVCHVASLSGAPFLLLEIIREFKKTADTPFTILVVKEGPLIDAFRQLGPTFIWEFKLKEPTRILSNRIINLCNKVKQNIYQSYILFALRGTTLVFLNTLANGPIQKKLLFLKSRFICYVHEMQTAIHTITNKDTLNVIKNSTGLFIGCSHAVKRHLVENIGIRDEDVRVFHTPLPLVHRDKNEYAAGIDAFKAAHAIPDDAILIGAIGPNVWRKGFDLLFPLVSLYYSLFPDAKTYFIWKGYDPTDPVSFFELYDHEKQAHKDKILLLPHDAAAISTIAGLDVHLLLSREDPYPLVVLEAASFGIPTVCFKNAGGAPEFIGDDCGSCVPYGDLRAMAEVLHALVVDPDTRERMGQTAQAKVAARHSKELCMPAFMKVLKNEK